MPSSEAIAAWRAYFTSHSRVTELLEKELHDRFGIPLTWYDVLVVLDEAPGGRLRMNELARQVLLSRAGLTRLVDRMEAAGLVGRAPCPEDRRGMFVEITPAGTAKNRETAPFHLNGVRRHFTDLLSPAELETLHKALDRVTVAAEAELV